MNCSNMISFFHRRLLEHSSRNFHSYRRKNVVKTAKLVLIFLLFSVTPLFAAEFPCLPPDIKEDSVVKVEILTLQSGQQISKSITVAETLEKLGARCSCGKLEDSSGKLIRFYNLIGCWGNPPVNYLELLDRQREEIERLKENYLVIEMTCNPKGSLIV